MIAAPDWQEALDDYLAWSREAEWRERALAYARARRAEAVRRMHAAGVSRDRIAWVVGLSKPRVNQLLRKA